MNWKMTILATLCLIFNKINATHMMGSDVTYTCLGPGKYKIVAKVYRDCRGVSLNNPTMQAFCDNASPININYTRTAINDISPTCVGGTKPCSPTNTTVSAEGIEEHVFEGEVDFNKSPFKALKDAGCCQIYFSVAQCCRNVAITTISKNTLHTEAMLDICAVGSECNSSPQLSIPPVAYICCNQCFTYNNGVVDVVDGDSLAFNLAPALNGHNSNETYVSPFSPEKPMTPFCPPNPGVVNCNPKPNACQGIYFDKLTGDIIFKPTNCEEVGVIVIEIKEYRLDKNTNKWKLIGSIRRDMQLVVIQCPNNNPPKITNKPYKPVCEGNKICFTIDSKDEMYSPNQTVPDTTYMNWNAGIPGASFRIIDPTAREKSGEFCWQTKIGDARPTAYRFTVTAKDNNCPRPAQANKGYNVYVMPKAISTRQYNVMDCGKLKFECFPKDTISYKLKDYTYEFTIRDSTNSGLPYYKGFKKGDSIVFKKGGKYIITSIINNKFNCPTIYVDTVKIPPMMEVELAFNKDTFVCEGFSITLKPKVSNGMNPLNYEWQNPIGNTLNLTSSELKLNPTKNEEVSLKITDKNKCEAHDTIFIKHQLNPIVNLGPDNRICSYEKAILNHNAPDSLNYYWIKDGDSSRIKEVSIAGEYIVKVIDHLGCFSHDTLELFVNDTVKAIAKPNSEICHLDTLKKTGDFFPKSHVHQLNWIHLNTNTTISNNVSISQKITNKSTQYYVFNVSVNQENKVCIDSDTLEVVVNELPKFNALTIPKRCYIEGRILLNHVTATNGGSADKINYYHRKNWVLCPANGSAWCYYDFPKFIENKDVKNGYLDTIYFQYKDPNGCYNKGFQQVKLNPNPTVSLSGGVFCQRAGLIDLAQLIETPSASARSGISQFRIIESPSASGVVNGSVLTPISNTPLKVLFDPGSETEINKTGIYEIEYCYKDGISGCYTCDTNKINVVQLPEIEFSSIPNQCINYPMLNLDSFVIEKNTQLRFSKGVWKAIEFNGSRDIQYQNILMQSIVNNKLFNPKIAGEYVLKFIDNSSGCEIMDSTTIRVFGLPKISLDIPDTLCSSANPISLQSNYPNNPNGIWSGQFVSGSTFNPGLSPKNKLYEGPYTVYFSYTNPSTKCSNKDSQKIKIQTQAEVKITTPKPYQQCENKEFKLNASVQWAKSITWKTNGDGLFNDIKILNTIYQHGIKDTSNGSVTLKIVTDKEGICPVVEDYIDLIIEPYPQFDFIGDPLQQCEPAIVNFTSNVIKPYNLSNIKYSWWFGNGDSIYKSDAHSPQNIKYDSASRNGYNIKLMVSNQWGINDDQSCNTTTERISYIKVWPVPIAAFTTDPNFFTTVAFPKFKFINQSKIKFGELTYLWNFDQNNQDDTSTQIHPLHHYKADTAKYWVNLQAIYQYQYNGENLYCMDSVGQRREIRPDVTVFVPTAFSPEGTGPEKNNKFKAVVNGEKSFEIILFNRWGEILWKSQDKNEGWNGMYLKQECQQDVYAWIIKVTGYDGKEYQYEGTVTLLR